VLLEAVFICAHGNINRHPRAEFGFIIMRLPHQLRVAEHNIRVIIPQTLPLGARLRNHPRLFKGAERVSQVSRRPSFYFSFFLIFAFALRTFADAAAAFLARADRCAFVIFLAAVFPPVAPVFLKNSSIYVTDPNLSTPQA